MTNCYRFAGRTVEIRSLFAAVQEFCREYRVDGPADFPVTITREDIEQERMKSAREDQAEGRAVRAFTDEYLETLAVYRQIAEKMPDYDTLLFHGSCVAADGAGYLFTAKSGTGKSTHTRLWRELLGERAVMVNDDKPLIRVGESEVTVFGTPWDGKHRLSCNIAVPLKGLCLLTRSEENWILPVTRAEAYPMLLQQVYRPADPAALRKTLTLLDLLASAVPLYRLGCNRELQAAELAYTMMAGEQRE